MSTMRSQDEIRNTVVSLGLPEHPYFMRRAARAMDLLDTGKVNPVGNTNGVNFVGDEIFRVHSQFDDQIYHVELNHGTPKGRKCVLSSTGCTCPDHQKNPGVWCKHMIAATIYQKQAQAWLSAVTKPACSSMIIRKRSDGVYGIIDGNHLVQISTVNGKRRCNCKNCRKSRQQADCKYKPALERSEGKAIRDRRFVNSDNHNNGGGGNGSPEPAKDHKITNDCGSLRAKQLQDKFNGQLKQSKSGNNNNGDAKSPVVMVGDKPTSPQPMQLDLSDPFQECESYDIDQIEGRKDGELCWKLSNGKYCISYAGVMKLADKHNIEFSVSLHDDTNGKPKASVASCIVIAKAMNGNSRVSGKPMNGCADTAIELAKRNAARQLLPLAEIKAVEHKAKLESEFDWQKAHAKCVELVGIEASVDIIIHELTQAGKLRQDTPSHYNRTEWLIIHNACQEDADEQPPLGSRN